MSNPWVVTAATVALIALSAFFVIIEFALLGARRHRLEEAAVTSRAARAALRSSHELTIMLAGAQLGITACTFALGAITKPAVDKVLDLLFESWGIPDHVSGVSAFVLSLLLVTFLHLVVGEMAPKSWAIAHPERAAVAIGLPARAYIRPIRGLLTWVNAVANRLVARSGVTPVDRAAAGGRDADTLRQLVEDSINVGALDASYRAQLHGALELESLRVGDLLEGRGGSPTAVPADAVVADVQAAATRTGHLRVLVDSGDDVGVVHVRDTLLADRGAPARQFAREAMALSPTTLAYEAFAAMRDASEQLAVVREDGRVVGVVTVGDILRWLLPRVDDEAGA
ncbi:CBS domain containing-hemolysin-like protein [Knoellia remsis]|uniref:CBS domain containing-hemolysin-like protein n=1 Tax=Knoellia remsis TaxID=407159 RepID=A0A2T0UXQ9_9MICO|nr:CNNM domain-containing protein [Knoellia remsis]PRY62702.1 CBS domain containing-hemolysin-like protein [Knoellia remsis]